MNIPWIVKKRLTGRVCLPTPAAVTAAEARWRGTCLVVVTNDEAKAVNMLRKSGKQLVLPGQVRAAVKSAQGTSPK